MARGYILRNQPEAAIEANERARRLSPFDPYAFFYAGNIGGVDGVSNKRVKQGRFGPPDRCSYSKKSIAIQPYSTICWTNTWKS
jgi:hypothetical protein